MPELRKDPVVGRWVIISTERSRRPTSFTPAPRPTGRRASARSARATRTRRRPRCSRDRAEGGAAEHRRAGRCAWCRTSSPRSRSRASLDRRGEGLYDKMNGIGAHEVVIETPGPRRSSFADLPVEHIAQVLRAYRERIARPASGPPLPLRADLQEPRRAGRRDARAHAHPAHRHADHPADPAGGAGRRAPLLRAQGALRVLRHRRSRRPPRTTAGAWWPPASASSRSRRSRRASRSRPGSCRAATTPSFQTVADPAESAATWRALLKDTLQRLNRALDRPPYNFVIHTAPVSDGDLEYYHWHLEIMPKLTRVAGFEIGSGFYINPTPPEDAAQYLRERRRRVLISGRAPVHEQRPASRSCTSRARWRRSPRWAAWRRGRRAVVRAGAARAPRVRGAAALCRDLKLPTGLDARDVGRAATCRGAWGAKPARFELLTAGSAPAARAARGSRRRAPLLRPPGHLRRSAHRRGLPRQRRALPVLRARRARGPRSASASRFDMLHAHDQPGRLGAVLRAHARRRRAQRSGTPPRVFTIHNLGYQGIHDAWVLGLAGFGRELFYPGSPFEFWGRVNSHEGGHRRSRTCSPR